MTFDAICWWYIHITGTLTSKLYSDSGEKILIHLGECEWVYGERRQNVRNGKHVLKVGQTSPQE